MSWGYYSHSVRWESESLVSATLPVEVHAVSPWDILQETRLLRCDSQSWVHIGAFYRALKIPGVWAASMVPMSGGGVLRSGFLPQPLS